MTERVGFVGTGNPNDRGGARAYVHANAYERIDDCELVACADIVRENAEAFANEYGIDDVYEDYAEMFREAEPDVVSVAVPPSVHAPAVIDAADAGAVGAIYCEKPVADTWGAAREMVKVCRRNDVTLAFSHQRRFAPVYRRAKELLDGGAIGDLQRIEMGAYNAYDWGTHSIDLANMFVAEADVEWVLGQVDYAADNEIYGAPNDTQGLACWEYENGVRAVLSTGGREADDGWIDCGFVDTLHRLLGTDGVIEVKRRWGEDGYPDLRLRRHGETEWEGEDFEGGDGNVEAIEDFVAAHREGREPELSGRRALNATEIIFAIFESSRRRGRVDLPLAVEDNPLAAMIEAGELPPGR